MTSITFANPWWLLVALLAIPVALTGLWWFTATMSRARAISAIALRSVLLALIAAMLAGASAVQSSSRVATIVVVDVSDSVRQFAGSPNGDPSQSVINRAKSFIETLAADPERRADDALGVVVFDGRTIATQMPAPRPLESQSTPARDVEIDYRLAEGTDLERALRFASALFPPDAARRLVVISDGNQTEGDALAAARELAAEGAAPLPIDVVPITYRAEGEVFVKAVDAPPQATEESTVDVRVILHATQNTTGRLELLYAGDPVDLNGPDVPDTGLRVSLSEGDRPFRLPVKLRPDRFHRFRAIFIPDDASADRVALNNSAESYTITPGKGSVLIVDGVGDDAGRVLPTALTTSGIETLAIAPDELPTDLLGLQAYDLIILQNVPAEAFPRQSHTLLADYVTQLGGGLVMVGGPDSLGAGGWNGTALEDVLPVELDLPEQLLVPSAAIAIVLDNSGSMAQSVLGGARSKQEIANESAALAIETLDASDLVSVIAFNSDYDIVVPMERNDNARSNADRVRGISTGGGTNMYPALNRAFQDLQRGRAAEAQVRHVILLSDGQSQGSTQMGVDLATRMREAGVSISTIAVGQDADTDTMRRIANAGGGEFYPVIDPNQLPRIFIRDIRVVRKPLIRETPFTPIVTSASSPITRDLPARIPELGGLVLSQHRDDPKVTRAMDTPEGEPLLAHWFVGRGQVGVFTSDAHDWARNWLSWSGYRTFWTQLARAIARPPTEGGSELTTEIDGEEMIIRFDAVDQEGVPIDLLRVPGAVFPPGGGEKIDIRLDQVGPGGYQTRVPVRERGNYVVALFPNQSGQALPAVVGAATKAVGVEFRRTRSNVGVLRQIASATGGTILDLDAPDQASVFSREGLEPVRASAPLWPVLLVWSVIFFLLDVATRRVAWDRLLTRELAMEVREQAASAVHARSARAATTVAALRTKSGKGDDGETRSAAPPPPAPLRDRPAPRSTPRSAPRPQVPARPAGAKIDQRRAEQRQKMLERLGKSGGSPTHAPSSAPSASDAPLRDPGAGKRVKRTKPPAKRATDASAGEAPGPDDDRSTTSGLLDAKRRARQRLASEGERPPAPPKE